MIDNSFTAAMTSEELLTGEARHSSEEQSRRLAMAAGLTKSSKELAQAWKQDPELYMTTLKAAIAAYEENKSVEELLVGAIARLVSVAEGGEDDVVERAMEIVIGADDMQAN